VGAALYIVLENDGAGVDNEVDGKALSRSDGDLAALCRQLGVKALMDFFSISSARFEAEAEQFNTLAGLTNVPPHEEEWFSADEGLATVRPLLTYLYAHPGAFPGADAAQADLEDFAYVLCEAARANVRWHLGVDY